MEENKDTKKKDAITDEELDEIFEDTIVFHRESDTIVGSDKSRRPGEAPGNTGNSGSPGNTGGRSTPRIPVSSPRQNSIPPEMQDTAKLQGGAVIRPLRPGQNGANRNQGTSAQRPQQRPAQGNYNGQNRVQGQAGGQPRPAYNQQSGQQLVHPQSQNPAQQNGAVRRPAQNNVQGSAQSRTGAAGQNQQARQIPQNSQSHQVQQNPQAGQNQQVSRNQLVPRSQSQNRQDEPKYEPRRAPMSQSASQTTPRRSPDPDFDFGGYDTDTSSRGRREREYSPVRDSASSAIMSAVKAVVYIVCVIAVAIPLAIFIINTANDAFAFVKEEKVVTVTIDEYATIDSIADTLYDAGVIKYKWAFRLWCGMKENKRIKAGNPSEFVAGTYEVSTTMNYDYLIGTFRKKVTYETVRITIPEGYTVDQIIDLFVSQGISSKEEFTKAINETSYDYKFLEGLTTSPNRIWRLEGYLFPDTYDFYKSSSAEMVVKKLLDNFDRKFESEYYDRCRSLGMTVDQLITLASMLEKEVKYSDELADVSSVFHNRLNHSDTFPLLQSDATVKYAIDHATGTILDDVTSDDLKYDSPYNTYLYRGLPPGPISNPSLNSISAALYPNETQYYYFVSNRSGHILFAKTLDEQTQNINIARGNAQ